MFKERQSFCSLFYIPLSNIKTSKNRLYYLRRSDLSQVVAYAANRGPYTSSLFDTILDYYKLSCRLFDTLLDVGYGLSKSTRPLTKYFDTVFSIDPSLEIIN